jgi:adenosylhomocysteine nucleosidase
LLIFTALRYEAVALNKALRPDNQSLRIHVIGPSAQNLPKNGDVAGCRGIIMAGLAGALDPALDDGDIIIDQPLGDTLQDARWHRGRIHTSDHLIATPAEKAALFASSGAAVVDMETAKARAFAERTGVPFLAIRAVSDRADQPLDPATVSWVTPAGGLRAGKVAVTLLRRPTMVPQLMRLRRRSNLAMQNLAEAIREILARSLFP